MASVKDSEEEKFLKLESLAEKTSRAINIIASNLDVAGTEVKVCLSDGLGANCNKGGEILSLTFIGKDAKAATTKARQYLMLRIAVLLELI